MQSELKLVEGLKHFDVVEVKWPKGEKHAGDPGPYFRDEIEVVVVLKAGDSVGRGEHKLGFVFTSQACEESGTCYPPEDVESTVMIEVVAKGEGDQSVACCR